MTVRLTAARPRWRSLGAIRDDDVADFSREVLRVMLDLTEVPALHRGYERNADYECDDQDFPEPPWQQEVEVAGVDDVHVRTLSSASDNPSSFAS
jgi:hypothetical protein